MWKYLQLQPSHSKHGTSLMAMFVGLGVFLIPLMATHVQMWKELSEPDVSQFKYDLEDMNSSFRYLERDLKKSQSLVGDEAREAVYGAFSDVSGRGRGPIIPTRALDTEGEERIEAALVNYYAWIKKGLDDYMASLYAIEEGKIPAELHLNFAEGAAKVAELSTVATAELDRPVILRPELLFEMYLVGSPILFLAALFHALLGRRSRAAVAEPVTEKQPDPDSV